MSALSDLYNKVKMVNDGLKGSLVRDVLVKHRADIIESQQIQLLSGKTSSGKDIHPFYTEDIKPQGYFNSVESAKRYSAWKDGLNYPYQATRKSNVPNLYVNGRFHSELGVEYGTDYVAIVPTTAYASGIIDKYGLDTFGLTMQNWDNIFREKGALAELIDEIKEILF